MVLTTSEAPPGLIWLKMELITLLAGTGGPKELNTSFTHMGPASWHQLTIKAKHKLVHKLCS